MDLAMKVCMYSFAFFMPWSITGSQISLGAMLALQIGIWITTKRMQWRWDPMYIPLILFMIGVLISIAVSPDPKLSFIKGSRIWILSIYFLFANHLVGERSVRNTFKVLTYVTAIIAIYSIVFQHFMGLDPLRVIASPTELFQKKGGYFHAVGLFDHHLTYGNSLMMVLFLNVALFFSASSRKEKIALAGAFVLSLAALFFTYARGPWMGFMAGCMLYGFVKGKKGMAILAVAVILIGGAFYFGSKSVRDRMETVAASQADVERIITWQIAVKMIKDYPIFGVGPGMFHQMVDSYRTGYNVHFTSRSHAHNSYLQVLVESGIVGFIPLVMVLTTLFYVGSRKMYDKFIPPLSRELTLGSMAALTAFWVAALFQHNLGDGEVAMLMWFIAAAALRGGRRDHVQLGYESMAFEEERV